MQAMHDLSAVYSSQREKTSGRLYSRRTSRISWRAAAMAMLVVAASSGCRKEEAPAAPPPPPQVEVTSVIVEDVPVTSEWVATLDGYVNEQISPRVSGYLLSQKYAEGTVVHKGDLLFEIDARPFEAALDQAKGVVAQTEAQLGKADMDVARDTPLARQSAIPQAQLDNDVQAKAAAEAQVISAKAQVDLANLNLSFTKVYAHTDGVAGIAKAQVGDLVGPGTVLTTISQVNPIKAYFALSEREYLRAAQRISAVASGRADARHMANNRNLDLLLADGSTFPTKGWLVYADRQVDDRTGTLRVAGAFENPGAILRPGQFGRVRATTGTLKDAILVPQRSVTETQGLYSVVVIGDDNKASIRPVKTGDRFGQLWVISEGLKPGERVIVDGTQKVREGTEVRPVQSAFGQKGE